MRRSTDADTDMDAATKRNYILILRNYHMIQQNKPQKGQMSLFLCVYFLPFTLKFYGLEEYITHFRRMSMGCPKCLRLNINKICWARVSYDFRLVRSVSNTHMSHEISTGRTAEIYTKMGKVRKSYLFMSMN